MKNKFPRSPFSTRLSGSARETELRIRSIFQWKKQRPPLALMALVAVLTALCGYLVSCQPRTGGQDPSLVMETQYYDVYENYVEIPALAMPAGAEEDAGAAAINAALDALRAEYQPILDGGAGPDPYGLDGVGNHCLLYPSDTGRYLNLLFFREVMVTDLNTGHLLSLVYDKQAGKQVTLEEALSLAGETEQGLYDALSAQYAPELAEQMPDADLIFHSPALEAFRMGADGQPVFYLTARVDDRDDTVQDAVSGSGNLYVWADGSFTLYAQHAIDRPPLVPAEECLDLNPPLYRQWYYAGEEPEGGLYSPADPDGMARRLAQLALEQFDSMNSPQAVPLLSQTQQGHTLLLARVTGGPHVAGLDNLVLGVFDGDSGEFLEPVYALGGDEGLFSSWEEDGGLHLLLANSTIYQGDETSCGLLYFRFRDGALEPVHQVPGEAFSSGPLSPSDPGAQAMLHPFQGGDWTQEQKLAYDFWFAGRKALPIPGGFELYEKNPDWNAAFPGEGAAQWRYAGFVPFTSRAVDPEPPAVRAAARTYRDSFLWEDTLLAGAPIHALEQAAEWTDLSHLSLAPAWRGREGLSVVCYQLCLDRPGADYDRRAQLVFLRQGGDYTYVGAFSDYTPDALSVQPDYAAGLAPYNRYALETLRAGGVLASLPNMTALFRQLPAPPLAWEVLGLHCAALGQPVFSPHPLSRENWDYLSRYPQGAALPAAPRSPQDPPQEDDLRLEELQPRLMLPMDTGELVAVFELALSRYQGGGWVAQAPRLAFFHAALNASYYTRVSLQAADSVTDLDRAAREFFWGLTDLETALWDRSVSPATPIGPGPVYYWCLTSTGQRWDGDVLVYEEGDRYTAQFYQNLQGERCLSLLDTTRRLPTTRGARVGDSRTRVKELYPELRSDPYPGYSGDYLWYCSRADGSGPALLFFFQEDVLSRLVLTGGAP